MEPFPRPEIHTFVGAGAAVDRRALKSALDLEGILHDWLGDDLLVPEHRATEVATLIERTGRASVVSAEDGGAERALPPWRRWSTREMVVWGGSAYALLMGLAAWSMSLGHNPAADALARAIASWAGLFVVGVGIVLARTWDVRTHRRAAVLLVAAAALSLVAAV